MVPIGVVQHIQTWFGLANSPVSQIIVLRSAIFERPRGSRRSGLREVNSAEERLAVMCGVPAASHLCHRWRVSGRHVPVRYPLR